MPIIKWSRQFGIKQAIEMERELHGERIATCLVKIACKIDWETRREMDQAESAREIAYDLVYGRIDGKEAARRFYGCYY